MKLLRLVSYGFPGGGVETGIIKTDALLKEKGYTVKVISSNVGEEKGIFSDYQFKRINTKTPLKIFTHLFNIHSYLCVKKVLAEFQPDIVHLHTMQEFSPSVLFLLKKIPTVLTIHGPEEFTSSMVIWTLPQSDFRNSEYSIANLTLKGWLHYFYQTYIQRPIYLLGFRNVDQFISVSNYILRQTKDVLTPNTRIYNGIQLMRYSKIIHQQNLLCIGRIEKVKGFDYAIKALPIIIKEFPNAILTILGDGEYKQNLLKLVHNLHVEKNVKFINWLPQDKLEEHYQKATIVLLPSIWPEAFGKIGIEALSTGRPVIGTNQGGIPEWLHNGKNGYVIESKSELQIAEKVIYLFKNQQILEKMSHYARKSSEDFAMEKYVEKIDNLYRNLLNNKKAN